MRIYLDTNVLISIFVFRSKGLEKILRFVCEKHTLVLSSYCINELIEVIREKFPQTLGALDDFLQKIPYEVEPRKYCRIMIGLPFGIKMMKKYFIQP